MSVLNFLFGTKRLMKVEDGQAEIRRENATLKAKIARLEIALNARRADDIVGSRDALIPVPRPGTSAARLLTQNRRLRERARAAEDRATRTVETALSELETVAKVVDRVDPRIAADMRDRAWKLAARAETTQPIPVDSSADLYVEQVRATWKAVSHTQVAGDMLVRLTALDPRGASRWVDSAVELAAAMEKVIRALLRGGPQAAATTIRSIGDVTEDLCALGGEALLYALAGGMGAAWTEDVRSAWAIAIDDVAKALGYPSGGGALFSTEDSIEISSI